MYVIEMLRQSTFQVVAIQFGTDELQGVYSCLSTLKVHWGHLHLLTSLRWFGGRGSGAQH